jgi:hypothetical protein
MLSFGSPRGCTRLTKSSDLALSQTSRHVLRQPEVMVQQADFRPRLSSFRAVAVPGSESPVGHDPSDEVFVVVGVEAGLARGRRQAPPAPRQPRLSRMQDSRVPRNRVRRWRPHRPWCRSARLERWTTSRPARAPVAPRQHRRRAPIESPEGRRRPTICRDGTAKVRGRRSEWRSSTPWPRRLGCRPGIADRGSQNTHQPGLDSRRSPAEIWATSCDH